MVEVEAGVDIVGCCNDVAPDIATRNSGTGSVRKLSLGRECKRVFHEFGVTTFVSALIDVRHEGFIQIEDVLEVVEGHDGGSWETLVEEHSRQWQAVADLLL